MSPIASMKAVTSLTESIVPISELELDNQMTGCIGPHAVGWVGFRA